ncbi:asparaginase [Thiomonas sp. FB-Cd]|uniref:asparaginase n=1 Tax=Thiomonas sp. FB-Cd TaxID=1158292 RepID=UPI000B232279|nr:asparaginase [Thiomonas sp. FB-Cd]
MYFYPDMKNLQPSDTARLPKVLVLGTGGTIAGVSTDHPAQGAYRAAALDIGQLVAAAPGIERLAALQAEQLASLDSKDMRVQVWGALASRIAAWREQPDVAGCVITHGSDTVEETAYFLQCVLPAGKPVVLTAAMRPATALSADGPRNLYDAVQVAASADAAGRGVLCVVHGRVHGACDITKAHPTALDAFSSGERGPLGFAGSQGVLFTRNVPAPNVACLLPIPPAQPWPRVELVSSHAGADGAMVRALLAASSRGELVPPLAGLVVQGTGGGTVHEDLQQVLNEAEATGVRVAYGSRVGGLQGGLYDGLNAVKIRIRLMLELAADRAN